MNSIRFIPVGYLDITLIDNLANNLSSQQNEFQFLTHDKILKLPKRRKTSLHTIEQIERMAQQVCSDDYPDDYPVVICNGQFERYKFAKISDDVTVITIGAWADSSSPDTLQKYIAYALVDALMSRHVQYPAHYDRRGCVADTWFSQSEVEAGLARSEYCSDCRSLILQAIGAGISLQQVAAIFRLLDYVAERKTCFVIMPFQKTFDAVYANCLQRTLKNQKWVCRRADKIFQSREIMTLVWEEILRSDLIIADLSGKNANVFYELGYADALNKRTILITQSIKDVPFDLRHRQLIQYEATPRGLRKLSDAIVKYL